MKKQKEVEPVQYSPKAPRCRNCQVFMCEMIKFPGTFICRKCNRTSKQEVVKCN